MSRSIIARAHHALAEVNNTMTQLMDIGKIPDNSPVDRKVQAALEDLYTALHEVRANRRNAALRERGPLIFPVRGKDMRFWRMSDGRRASSLLEGRRAARVASASKVMPSPALNRYRTMTASQYLEALEDAVITDPTPPRDSQYQRVRVMV